MMFSIVTVYALINSLQQLSVLCIRKFVSIEVFCALNSCKSYETSYMYFKLFFTVLCNSVTPLSSVRKSVTAYKHVNRVTFYICLSQVRTCNLLHVVGCFPFKMLFCQKSSRRIFSMSSLNCFTFCNFGPLLADFTVWTLLIVEVHIVTYYSLDSFGLMDNYLISNHTTTQYYIQRERET